MWTSCLSAQVNCKVRLEASLGTLESWSGALDLSLYENNLLQAFSKMGKSAFTQGEVFIMYRGLSCLYDDGPRASQFVKSLLFSVTWLLEGIIPKQETLPACIFMNENAVPIIRNGLPFFF